MWISKFFKRGHNHGFGSGLVDMYGRQAFSTIFGEGVTGSHVDDVSCQFQYNNSTVDVNTTLTGTGYNTNANSMAKIGVAAGGVGYSSMISVDSIRYRPGHEMFGMQTARFVGAGPGVTHFIGIGNGSDRLGWGTNNGEFGIWFWEGGNKTFVAQANFLRDRIDGTRGRGNESGFNIDPTQFNLYMPSTGWLGIAPILFGVHGGAEKGWLLPTLLDFTNTIEEPHLQNPTLPLQAEVERLSGDGEAFIETSSWRGGVVSGREEDNNSNRKWGAVRTDVVPVSGASAIDPPSLVGAHVVTIKSKELFQGKTNHVKAMIKLITGTNAFNKTVLFETWPTALLKRDQAGLPAFVPTLVDNDPDNSILQFDESTVDTLVLPDDANRIDLGIVRALDQRTNNDVIGANIFPGDEITITARAVASGSGEVDLQLEGFELF
jgi:hypothetical protein